MGRAGAGREKVAEEETELTGARQDLGRFAVMCFVFFSSFQKMIPTNRCSRVHHVLIDRCHEVLMRQCCRIKDGI